MLRSNRSFPFRYNNRFFNFPGEKTETIASTLHTFLLTLLQKKHGLHKLEEEWVIKESESFISSHAGLDPLITCVGHATFLIQVGGLSIITDPIFGNPSSLFPRLTQSGISFEHIPHIDVVVISHNHPDHLDEMTLKALFQKNPAIKFFVPWGDKQWFWDRGFLRVEECMWWDTIDLLPHATSPVQITFLPARHWSGRGLFDWNKSLWGSWMISSSVHTVYFAGDSAYGAHFKEIAHHFPTIDTALMPVGPCEPHQALKDSHLNPEEAGQAFLDLNAVEFVPMHWGVYSLGTDYPLLPIERIQNWWKKRSDRVKDKTLRLVKFGQRIACKRHVLASISSRVCTSPLKKITPR